eukprot:8117569-Pyramimonas_sp.AAC.1
MIPITHQCHSTQCSAEWLPAENFFDVPNALTTEFGFGNAFFHAGDTRARATVPLAYEPSRIPRGIP